MVKFADATSADINADGQDRVLSSNRMVSVVGMKEYWEPLKVEYLRCNGFSSY